MLETEIEFEQSNILAAEPGSLRLPAGYSLTLYDSKERWWTGQGETYYSTDESQCVNLPAAAWDDKAIVSLDMWKGQVY